jgi:hypothetical protein
MDRVLRGRRNAAPRHGDAHGLKDIGGFEFVESHNEPAFLYAIFTDRLAKYKQAVF